jgi:hypothetical protein
MNNKKLLHALACLSLVACQQLMAMIPVVDKSLQNNPFEELLAGERGKKYSLITQALLSDGLIAGRYEGLDLTTTVGQLDYATSKSLRIAIPKTNYQVVADFGFAGSGDLDLELMMPLPTVRIQLALNEDVASSAAMIPKDLSDFGRIVIENELNKIANSSNGDIEIFKKFGISPIVKPRGVFLLKLALLIDHTVKSGDLQFFQNEIARLVFRLVVSGDIGTADALLSSLIPESFITVINQTVPGLLPIVDQIFTSTKNLLQSTKDQSSADVKTFAFVFNNHEEAGKFEIFAKSVLGEMDCEAQLENHLTAVQKMQAIDFEDFYKLLKDDNSSGMKTSLNFLVGKVVAHSAQELVDEGVLSAADAVAVVKQIGTVSVIPRGKLTVVCCCTDKASFDISETFSSVVKLVASAWNSYVDIIRTEIQNGHNIEATELLLEDAVERKELKSFFASDEGVRLQERLEKALEIARNPFEKVKQKRDQLLDELDKQELALEEEVAILAENRAAAKAMSSQILDVYPERYVACLKKDENAIAGLNTEIAAGCLQVQRLNTDIKRLEKAIASLEAELNTFSVGAKHIEMQQILQALTSQRKAGAGVDSDLRRRLEVLQGELEANNLNDQTAATTKLTVEEKLELRDAVLRVYEQELAQVITELAVIKDEAMTVGSLTREARLGVYKKFLLAQVDRRTTQKEFLTKLAMYKKALEENGALPADRMADLCAIERDLGFVFGSNDVQEICRVTKPKLSLAKRFIQEVSQPVAGSVFEPMHKKFVDGLATIISRSDAAGKNAVMVKYLLGMFLPGVQHQVLVKVTAQK